MLKIINFKKKYLFFHKIMSKIMKNSNQIYQYIKGNKHSMNKMNKTSTSKKNFLLSNESQEILKHQYSPIMQSRKLKKDRIITLTKKTNSNSNENVPNKISSNPKDLNKSKRNKKIKKNIIDKNKKELKNSYNETNGSLPKDYERVYKKKAKNQNY
jgi:ribosomal protein L17